MTFRLRYSTFMATIEMQIQIEKIVSCRIFIHQYDDIRYLQFSFEQFNF